MEYDTKCRLCNAEREPYDKDFCLEHIHLQICEAVARIKNGSAVQDIVKVARLAQRLAKDS